MLILIEIFIINFLIGYFISLAANLVIAGIAKIPGIYRKYKIIREHQKWEDANEAYSGNTYEHEGNYEALQLA